MVKQVKESPATSSSGSFASISFGLGLICIGSLLSLLGGACLLFFYPSECVLTDPAITCNTSEVLTLGGTIIFFCSGASMMLCGLATLCCVTEDEDEKPRNASTSKGKPCLKKTTTTTTTISATYSYNNEKTKRTRDISNIHRSSNSTLCSTLPAEHGRISDVIYYPPPSYYDPNLVYGCQTNTLKNQLENSLESQA